MCGLVGMVGFLENCHRAVMRDLLYLDTLRGKDSTGLTCVDRDRNVRTRKFTVPGYEFIEHPLVDRSMKFADQLWMGHNRYKTVGDASKQNAHPFEVLDDEGDIMLVGAHNGTLDNKWELERELKGDKFGTDSETLFNLLVEKPNFKEAIKLLRGAWSLTFWDPTTDSLHFIRNEQRPMVYAWAKDHKVLMWASESWMILAAANRNGMELEKNDNGLSCYSTLPDYLYTLEIPQERNKELPALERKGGYSGAPNRTFQKRGMYGWWGEEDNDPNLPTEEVEQKGKTEGEKRKEEAEATGEEEKKVIWLGKPSDSVSPSFTGFEGKPLSSEEVFAIRAKGCVWCKGPLQSGPFAFLDEDSGVCVKCLHDRHPKDGGRVRPESDSLDDDLPWKTDDDDSETTPEYKRLIDAVATGRSTKASS